MNRHPTARQLTTALGSQTREGQWRIVAGLWMASEEVGDVC